MEETVMNTGKARVRRKELAVLELEPSLVDVESPIPTYLQIEQDIRRQISESNLKGEVRLPRETELADLYGISRMTLRNALARLEKTNFIRRVHGLGTLVNMQSSKITCNLNIMKRLHTQIREQGFEPGAQIIQCKVVEANQKVSEMLNIRHRAETLFLERVITMDMVPAVLLRSWISLDEFPALRDMKLLGNSVWETIEKTYKRTIRRTVNEIELVKLNNQESQLLNIEDEGPAICLSGIAFDDGGIPLEYSIGLWGGNARIKFEASV